MAKLRKAIFRGHTRAQAFVEFAIIVPIFLIVLTGIIEFGYAVFTWAAVDEVARIGIRYAVTGQFDPQYCADADAALGLSADDTAGGDPVDCNVPTSVTDYETKTNALQDWARLPSVRDAAIAGGSQGLLIYPQNSGDYLQYIENPSSTFSQTYRGLPYANGFFNVSLCSNRAGAAIDPNPYYYDGVASYSNQFLGICKVNGKYMDDAGGPGDRVRLTVTYEHPLIIPFFNAIWPNLKISTTQDAIVEKYRTSRVTGLTSGIAILPTWSPTPLPTSTGTETLTPTSTATSTATPEQCADKTGSGLRGKYFGNIGASTDAQRFSNLVLERIDSTPYFDWGLLSPDPSLQADYFEVRWEGMLYPPYPGPYTFTFTSDDGIRAWLVKSGTGPAPQIINGWKDQSATVYTYSTNLECADYDIKIEYYEKTSTASMKLNWSNPMIGTSTNGIPSKYLFPLPLEAVPTRTNTPTPTPTLVPCIHDPGNGLRGEYYGNLGAVGDIQRFTNLVFTRTDATVNFNWGNGTPDARLIGDNFQVRWTGQIYPDYPGDYTFQFNSDDGFRVWIWNQGDPMPGAPVIDKWTGYATNTFYPYVKTLGCAYYNIRIDYYELTATAKFGLYWQAASLGIPFGAIPQRNLFAPTDQPQPTSTYVTFTPTNTNTPTDTPIPPTPTNTATPTDIPPYMSPTPTSTSLPPTDTPTPSSTPTRCPTSTDLGGCG